MSLKAVFVCERLEKDLPTPPVIDNVVLMTCGDSAAKEFSTVVCQPKITRRCHVFLTKTTGKGRN